MGKWKEIQKRGFSSGWRYLLLSWRGIMLRDHFSSLDSVLHAGHWQSSAVQQDVLQWHLHWGAHDLQLGDITSWGRKKTEKGQKGNGFFNGPTLTCWKSVKTWRNQAKQINWDNTVLNFINTYASINISLVQVLPASLSGSYLPVSRSLGEICFGEVREER